MIEVYIDGASAGDPGPSGAGIFIKNNGEIIRKSIPLGIMSNHEAECWALIKALEICIEKGFRVISVRTDSQFVNQTIEKQYVKNEKYRTWLTKTLTLIDHFDLFFIKWIPNKQNKTADELAKKAIHLNKS